MIESVIKKATKKVHSVSTGIGTLKDAVSETMREWTRRIDDTHYVLGSAMGPHPFPTIVRDFQAVISKEAREQILAEEGLLPDAVIACVGGGSNAIGSFYNFINDKNVELIGCEAAGKGADTFETAANLRALSACTTTDKIFSVIAKIRQKTQISLMLMTYANVVYSYDTELFLKKAASVGVDGLILADVPYE